MRINTKKVILFLAITFAADWALAGAFFAAGLGTNRLLYGMLAALYMLVPAASAFIVQSIYRERVVGPLRVSFALNKWFLVAWLAPVALALGAWLVSLLLPGVSYTSDPLAILGRVGGRLTPEQLAQAAAQMRSISFAPLVLTAVGLFAGLLAGATINAVFAFGEELGWRGLLLRELAPLGFWKSAGVIGLIWGVWHAPLIFHGHNYPQHPVLGVAMMTLWTLLLSPILSYVTLRARSVVAAAVLHGTINGVGGLSLFFLKGGNDLSVGLTGLAGMVVLALANVAVILHNRRASVPIDELLTSSEEAAGV